MSVKDGRTPEMFRYYPFTREYAGRLAADERLERFTRERTRKFNKERWSMK